MAFVFPTLTLLFHVGAWERKVKKAIQAQGAILEISLDVAFLSQRLSIRLSFTPIRIKNDAASHKTME